MKRNRKLIIGLILSGVFLAYFSASFIFVPKAAGLQDQNTTIVKLEAGEGDLTHGMFRVATEHSEDAAKFFNYCTISFLESFHTTTHQNQLTSLQSLEFGTNDIYLSIRRLQI